MRPSAEIGSEKITRSTRVRRANSTRSSTVPSLGMPAQLARAAIVAAVVEHADDAHVGIALRGERADQRFAAGVGADHDGAAIEPALRVQRRTSRNSARRNAISANRPRT